MSRLHFHWPHPAPSVFLEEPWLDWEFILLGAFLGLLLGLGLQ